MSSEAREYCLLRADSDDCGPANLLIDRVHACTESRLNATPCQGPTREYSWPNGDLVRETLADPMKNATWVLRENVRALLKLQNKSQLDLSMACGHPSKSWANKFINGAREVQLEDLDRIAQFFHVETYQLFVPGIAGHTERRSGRDRRSGSERRIGDDLRSMVKLRPYVGTTAQRGLLHAPESALKDQPGKHDIASLSSQFKRLSHEAAIKAQQLEAREQAAVPRGPVPKVPRVRRNRRRRDVADPLE